MGSFTKKARTLYDENLNAYVKIMFRRPFGKIIVSILHPLFFDVFDDRLGITGLL